MISSLQHRHVVDEAGGVLEGGEELPVDAVGIDHTIFFGVKYDAVQRAGTNLCKDYRVLRGVGDFPVKLF